MIDIKTNSREVKVYICPGCDEAYKSYREAQNCCPVEEENWYECLTCGELYEDEEEADTCCEEDDGE